LPYLSLSLSYVCRGQGVIDWWFLEVIGSSFLRGFWYYLWFGCFLVRIVSVGVVCAIVIAIVLGVIIISILH